MNKMVFDGVSKPLKHLLESSSWELAFILFHIVSNVNQV